MKENRHVMIFLFALAFILAQCIIELILVSFFINLFPSFGTFLYNQRTIPIVFHTSVTVILLWYAGKCGDAYLIRKNIIKENL